MLKSGKSVASRIAKAAKPRERNVRDELDKRVAAYGGVTRAMSYIGRKGAPDVLVLFLGNGFRMGCVAMVETKMVNGELSQHQIDEHALLRAAGIEVHVIVTMEQLDAWLPELP